MAKDYLQQYFDFAHAIEVLKKLERYKGQVYWRDYPQPLRHESVADHTWRLCVLILLFEDRLKTPIDTAKVLQMALIHDLPEVIAGDASPLGETGTGHDSHAFNEAVAKQRHHTEKLAAQQLFGLLPKSKRQHFLALWLEFEQQHSFESRLVKCFDKLEAVLQILEYTAGTLLPSHFEFVKTYSFQLIDIDPAVQQFGELIREDLERKYREFKK